MQSKITKLLAATNLLLLLGLAATIAWIGKIYLFDLPNYQSSYVPYVVNIYKSGQLIGHSFPIVSTETVGGDTVRTDFSEKNGGIVLVFDPFSCQPCLQLVLKGLQHIYDNLEDPTQLPIYAISKSPLNALSQYRRAFKLKYQLGIPIQGEDMDHLFQRTPVVFLVDSHNTILQCHYPLYKKEQFSALFFQELAFNYLSALKVNTSGFADSPLKKLRGVSLLEIIKGQHTVEDLF